MSDSLYIVVLNSFTTGARRYFAGDRYVDHAAQALRFSAGDAIDVAKGEQEKIGRSVMMDIERVDA